MMFQEAPNSKVTGPIFTDGGPKKPTNSAAMPARKIASSTPGASMP